MTVNMRRRDVPATVNAITGQVIDSAICAHRDLGPGLLERAYELALLDELRHRGHKVATQVPVDVRRRDRTIDAGFRMDMVVDDLVLVEIKAVDEIHAVHEAQVLTYLKLAKLDVGLLLNFNVPRLAQGIRRFVRPVIDP